jgi:hypothetical protein
MAAASAAPCTGYYLPERQGYPQEIDLDLPVVVEAAPLGR